MTDLVAHKYTANGTLDTGGRARIYKIIANGTGVLTLSGKQNKNSAAVTTWLSQPINATNSFDSTSTWGPLMLPADIGTTITVNIGALTDVTLYTG